MRVLHDALTVEDRFEITQVLARYGHVMDGRDRSGLAEVFAPEATFDVTSVGGPVYRGLAELEGFLALGDSVHPPFHLLANAWVFLEGGEVVSLSKWLTIDQHNGLPRSGDYRDTWRRTPGGWRISARVARVRWTGGPWSEGYDAPDRG
ncbi:nuclear transport factor 2 family protein [Agromyces aerolatus]|uniref:nuclear transport factor 2 family protein n=1 Tax=Agromyces sp. LY-1074 TaxID=3074080 RepID=UPI002860F6EB|nr:MULTISPECIES: nuclear transport factor 2 family protein [unclassified Agromyces]MDR5699111.1 nuclear transport factor 2 family protein [Agromyces sp. LY-1074]MDR5705110.1 nuclear transport factor 2 family protein [Agromyces sp. LY-1358]